MSLVADFVIPTDAPGLAEAVAEHDRFTARLTMAVGAFAVSRAWDAEGYASAAAWLRAQGYTRGDDTWMVSAADKLRCWPHTAAAWLEGRLTVGQIKVICAQVVDRHVALFAAHEAELVAHLSSLDMLGTLTAMRVWRMRADAINPGTRPDGRTNVAHLSSTLEIADSKDFDIPAAERAALHLSTSSGGSAITRTSRTLQTAIART